MVPLAVTSTAGWRRRLGPRWTRLHRLVYPVAILGCWHYYWLVKRDVREPLLYLVILAVLLALRFVARRSASRPA
jgi:sulfoxide reductase heme-binding subunit YedZ